jgi:hypothetical protein
MPKLRTDSDWRRLFYEARLDAVRLIVRQDLQAWYNAGMKRFQGRARLTRVLLYMTRTIGE